MNRFKSASSQILNVIANIWTLQIETKYSEIDKNVL